MSLRTPTSGRWIFRHRLYSEIHRAIRYGHSIGVFLIDLDDFFDQIRDLEEDHIAQLLIQVEDVLRTTLRKGDFVVRIAGDRFVALAQVLSPADSRIVAERLRMGILEHRFFAKGHPLHLRASVGFAVAPEDGQTVDYLLARAERALHQAKQRGKNRTEYLGRWDSPETFPPMVGRAEQVQEVEMAIRQGAPFVMIRGAMGMGKTRFLLELREIFRNQGLTVLGPYPIPPVPYPLAPILGAFIEEFHALNRPITQEFGPTLPFFAPLFSDLGIPIPAIPGVPETPTVSRRNLIFQTLIRLFNRLGRRGKTVLFLEDLERLDPDTIEFLQHLNIYGGLGQGIHIIASASRPLNLPWKIPVLEVELPPFSFQETQAYMMAEGGVPPQVSPEAVWKATKGNPLHLSFAVSILRMTGEAQIPRTPKETLSRLLSLLSRETREVLQIAAMTGEIIDDHAVAEFLSIPLPVVYEHLEKAKSLGLVHESDSRFSFVNGWTRATLVKSIPLQRRIQIHRFLGETYSRSAEDNALHGLLASMHFRGARQWNRSKVFALQAANRLNEVMAASTAKAIYQELWEREEKTSRRSKSISLPTLLRQYARLLHARYEWQEEYRVIRELLQILDEQAHPRRHAELWLHVGLNILLPQGSLTEAIHAAQRGYRLARSVRDPDLLADATYLMGLISIHRRKFEAAQYALRSSLSTAMKAQDPYRIGRAFLAMGKVHLFRLEMDPALKDLHAAARLFQKIQHPPQIAQVLAETAEWYRIRGHLEKALQNLQDAIGIAEVTGDLKNEWRWRAELGRIYATLGQFEEAKTCFEHSEQILDSLNMPVLRLYLLEQRLFASLRERNLPEASRWIGHIQRLLQAHPSPERWLPLELLWAEFHLLRGRPEQSQKLLDTLEPLFLQEDLWIWVHSLFLKAQTLYFQGAPERAYPLIQQSLSKVPKEIPVPTLWFARYRIEQALHRPAEEIRASLKRSVDDLMRMANAIKERRLRESFLERIEDHRQILEEAQKLL